jgi:hypothetical protein
MTYRPAEEFFGPPFVQRLPAILHLGLAVIVAGTVLGVEYGLRHSRAYEYLFVERHPISAHTLVALFGASAVAAFLRAGMRGVRVRPDFVEYRDLLVSLWPRVRRIRWAQIDRINVEPSGRLSLDLWDGSHDALPHVSDEPLLRQALERVAHARAIPWNGQSEIDDLDSEPLSDDP